MRMAYGVRAMLAAADNPLLPDVTSIRSKPL